MHLTAAYTKRQLMALMLVLVFLLAAYKSESQVVKPDSAAVDVARIRFSKTIYTDLRYEVQPLGGTTADRLATIDISKPLPEGWRGHRVPPAIVEKQLLLKISLVNTSDTVQSVYFYPGAYFQKFDLYRVTAQGNADMVPEAETPSAYRAAFRRQATSP